MSKSARSFRRILSLFLAMVCGLLFCAPYPQTVRAAEATVTMDKTAYTLGEKAQASWTGITGNGPWWAIYDRAVSPGADGVFSELWKYIPAGDGSTDFSDAEEGSWDALEPGDYKLCIFGNEDKPNGLYVIQAQFDFSIVAETPDPPKQIAYTRTAQKRGAADGTVTITDTVQAGVTGYSLYWGDANGPLAGYAPFVAAASGSEETTYTFAENTWIPANATRLYAFARRSTMESATGVYAELPENAAADPQETPLLKFEVMSDLHVNENANHLHNQHLDDALKDVKTLAPDSDVIVFNGDITDFGQTAQYNQVKSIVQRNSEGLPEVMYVIGNHELRDNTGYNAQISRFKRNFNVPNVYYKQEYKGFTFLALGSEVTAKGEEKWNHSAHISDAQFAWLEAELKQASDGAKPVFLFIHQPLKNTTSGSLDGQDWDGIREDARLHSLLKRFPQVTMFNGHTHWELEARQMFYNGKGLDFSSFNDGAIGYLWTDAQTSKEGAQGLFVEVYADKIVVKGRDYVNDRWISSAQFMVDISQNIRAMTETLTADAEHLLTNAAQLKALRTQIDSLSDAERQSLSAAAEKLDAALAQAEILRQPVDALGALLDALHTAASQKTVNKADLEQVKELYAALSDDQKAQLPSYAAVVAEAEAALQTQETPAEKPDDTKPEPKPDNQPSAQPAVQNGRVYRDGKLVKNALVQIGGKTYAANAKGKVVKNGVYKIKGVTYAFDKKGVRIQKTGVQKLGGRYYYLKKGKVRVKAGWVKASGRWYHVNKKGRIDTRKRLTHKNKPVYVGAKGYKIKKAARIKIGGKLYRIQNYVLKRRK